jgi:hypothetical protein
MLGHWLASQEGFNIKCVNSILINLIIFYQNTKSESKCGYFFLQKKNYSKFSIFLCKCEYWDKMFTLKI